MISFTDACNLYRAEQVVHCKVRDVAQHGNFEDVAAMLLKEKSLNKLRRHRKIMEHLGEEYFKIHTLNFDAFLLKDEFGDAINYIEGIELQPSPALSQDATATIVEVLDLSMDRKAEFNMESDEEDKHSESNKKMNSDQSPLLENATLSKKVKQSPPMCKALTRDVLMPQDFSVTDFESVANMLN